MATGNRVSYEISEGRRAPLANRVRVLERAT
jgi:hypothetical protein